MQLHRQRWHVLAVHYIVHAELDFVSKKAVFDSLVSTCGTMFAIENRGHQSDFSW